LKHQESIVVRIAILFLCATTVIIGKDSTPPAFRKSLPESDKIHHALSRLTFGERPGDAAEVRKVGLDQWIDRQLHPDRIDENPILAEKLQPLEALRLSDQELVAKYPLRKAKDNQKREQMELPQDPAKRREAMQFLRRIRQVQAENKGRPPQERLQAALAEAPTDLRRQFLHRRAPVAVIAHDITEAKIYRAVYSNRQLEEVLVDFWFNHFNVFLDKGADRVLTANYERDAIRPHVLGKFRDLLQATAESPAMLFYLDNWQSVGPAISKRSRPRPKQVRGLNENYARELLELHTLGVDRGYTQQDVVEVARCFTGWTIQNPRGGGGFQFQSRIHDRGEKQVLGVRIPAGRGQEDGLQVLDIVSRHPSTARFLSYKLAQRFVADQPPQELVNRMAETFRKTDGDIRAVLQTLFASREFWSRGAYQAKIKSPLEMVAGAVRATGAEVDSAFRLAQVVASLGQPLYRKQEPTGYPNASDEWLNSATLVARMNFALDLSANRLTGIRVPQSGATLAFTPSPATRKAIEQQLSGVAGSSEERSARYAGLVLGSPEFQKR
jgi:uncharacterized protein (DUF1800 family)